MARVFQANVFQANVFQVGSSPSYRGPSVDYVVELLDSDANWGPGTKLVELGGARNLGWSRYDRIASKGFLTLSQNDPDTQYLIPLRTHVRMTRCIPSGNTTVYEGIYVNPSTTGDDAVLAFSDYLGLLAVSRCGYRTMYPTKLLGTEIVAPEWALAKAVTGSRLGFVSTGTIEDPLADNGLTPIKTDTQFGTMDQSRLRLFYDISEMGRANTSYHVSFGISLDSHAFSFQKDQGVLRSFGLDLNGRVVDYRHDPNWTHYRNNLASVGQDSAGGTSEIVAKDDAQISGQSYSLGNWQDVYQIATLLGIAESDVTADQQVAAVSRMLARGIHPPHSLNLQILEGALNPGVDFSIGDKAPVQIVRGLDNINSNYRIMGCQAFYNDGGEQLSVLVSP
jgi:hypothetical protein